MLDIKREYIEAFINHPYGKVGKDILCRNTLLLHFATTIPTALLGVGSEVTKFILFPLWIVMFFWGFSLYARKDIEQKIMSFCLYMGCSAVFFSFVFLLAAYKLYSMIAIIPYFVIIYFILTHIVVAILVIIRIRDKVKNGAYLNASFNNMQGHRTLVLVVWSLAILMRLFVRNILYDQEIAVTVLVLLLILYSYIFLYGIHFLFRYYFIRQLNKL